MMKKISFIIPIYNTDIKKLQKCIHSIQKKVIHQSYEINLIDDGSNKKNSKQYKNLTNNNISYFYKSNGGVSSARNLGIEKSSGEYICFLDSDDFLIDWVEWPKNADMVICDMAFNNTTNIVGLPFKNLNVTTSKFLCELVKNSILNAAPGKIFKKSFLDKYSIRFNEELIHGEDLNFLLEIIKNYPEIIYIPKCIYMYMYNAQTTNKRFKQQPFKILNNYIYNYDKEINLLEQYKINHQVLNTVIVGDLFNLYLTNAFEGYNRQLLTKIVAFLERLTINNDNSLTVKIRLILLRSGNSVLFPIAVLRKGYLRIKH
ncbi:glycosyltransferase family 2 protein [Limosilactobacillus reuteri]|uniref:glycosyltransferase family 2 protein n=1 Tax=Limosilactobacillus reuteri TaxID=1598 RepID=UPI00128D18D1|nr:glycosyltransferase family A protein [Limosilactobacillus reuteri]